MGKRSKVIAEANTFDTGNSEPKTEVKKTKKSKASKFNFHWIHNEQIHQITGLLLILISVFLTIAFISYLFTWRADFDKVQSGWWSFISNKDLKAENWLGKLGSLTANSFFYNSFGISSFLFVLMFFLTGFKLLFKDSLLPFGRTIRISAFLLVFVSVAMGYLFKNASTLLFMGGTFGYELSQWMQLMMGNAGTGLFLGFTLLAFSMVTFKFKLKLPQRSLVNNDEDDISIAETDDNTNAFKEPLTTELEEEISQPIDLTPEPDMEKAIKDLMETPVENTPSIEDNSLELEINSNENPEENVADDTIPLSIETPIEEVINPVVTAVNDELPDMSAFGEYDPTLDLSGYQFPSVDLLENYQSKSKLTPEELKAELDSNKNRIVETLGHYNIGIEKIKATVGPTVTLFEIIPQAGVRISKIKNLEDDIALSLSALGIRIIAPIPGKGTIGIEVPNKNQDMVAMKSVLSSDKFVNSEMDLPIGLGKTISNEVFVTDLAKMPHLLMAGATGQGKSVGLNAILVSLLYKKHPSQIKFVLVDPKKVELTLFKTIERHFLAKLPGEEEAIITDTKKVVNTLNSLCIEMDQRYELLKEAQVRNIREYNAKFVARRLNPNKGHRFLPFIVLVVDEFADLIMTAGKEVEAPIARLAQLARAIGIHLIIATQRPSVNIITGTIKANFPARIAFRVTSKIDSRTILDSGGADQLIGRGDMLLSLGADLIRLQCAFVDTPEVEKITDFIGSQRGYPDAFLLPEFVGDNEGGNGEVDLSDRDPLFDDAARMVVQHQQGSASLLQRRLKLGYNRAGRLIDQLEAAGIIGPFEGSKAREVKFKDPTDLENLLSNLK
ncbi:MAG: DNA translocase FtsK [Bacteroidetes bacterium]|jgi:S-DNA-T family DNA segregation ATPase FtsK/SpoIIIE|nr:DNA translocase FtsK [Bacteroidota bacterium]